MSELDSKKQYKAEITEPKKKRSLDANGYYWTLLNKFARWARVSETWLHNDILARFGQPELIEGRRMYLVMADSPAYKELSYIHLKPTSETKEGSDGKIYRTFVVMRGSHDYDTAEFSRLVDGLIQDIICSGAPIETMTPAELATLKGYAA